MKDNHNDNQVERELYLGLCEVVDNILLRAGIKRICIDCSLRRSYKFKPKIYSKFKGCCIGCRHLTPKGCNTKSLICKVWLCHSNLLRHIKKNDLILFRAICEFIKVKGWDNYRSSVEDYFG